MTVSSNRWSLCRRAGARPQPPGRGFTLIELVIVIAIIVLLASILLPSLRQAIKMVECVVCQSQLRDWGVAFSLYASDNDGFFPHTDGLDRDGGPADQCGWVDLLPPLMGRQPWREHPPWEKPGVGTIFQCRGARLLNDGLYSYNAERNGFFSYAMNSCLELDENCWRPLGGKGEIMPSFLPTKLIDEPSQVVLLFDQLLDPAKGYNGKKRYRDAGKYCGSYPKAFSARHARQAEELGGNILYCDYHVEWAGGVWKDHWPADLEVPPRDDSNWFPYPP